MGVLEFLISDDAELEQRLFVASISLRSRGVSFFALPESWGWGGPPIESPNRPLECNGRRIQLYPPGI